MSGDVYDEVRDERSRQDAKWGEQNHRDVDPVLTGPSGRGSAHALYGIPTAARARLRCDTLARAGWCTWADIAIEELAEAIEEAAAGNTAALRGELVQSAAVLVAWIEAIDRRAPGRVAEPSKEQHQ